MALEKDETPLDRARAAAFGEKMLAEAHIVRIPVAEGSQPVNITQSDPASKWGFEVSPDGRFIAYPGEIWKGSSVWRINLAGAAP